MLMLIKVGLPLILLLGTGGLSLNLVTPEIQPELAIRHLVESSSEIQADASPVDELNQADPSSQVDGVAQADASIQALAMTWRILDTRTLNGKTYVLFGSDEQTDPYQGDTSVQELRSQLCIRKGSLPQPEGLPATTTTPGGALRGSWSGGEVLIIPNVPGTALRSQAVADRMCQQVGMATGRGMGFRMAEFHDGDQQAGWAGWDFWAEAYGPESGLPDGTARYWVHINDQPAANPW
jgi:hypothetical protein